MEFEIEEQALGWGGNGDLADTLGAVGGVELAAEFDAADDAVQAPGQADGVIQRRRVDGAEDGGARLGFVQDAVSKPGLTFIGGCTSDGLAGFSASSVGRRDGVHHQGRAR